MCVHIRGGTRSFETYGAALALTGELTAANGRIGLAARLEELPRARSGAKILLRKFDIEAPDGDVQAAASRFLGSVAAMLEVDLPQDAMAAWRRELPRNPEAFAAYLRGRALLESGRAKVAREGEPGLLQAAEQFNRAIDQDYAFALAHVGLGDAYRLLYERTADAKWSIRSRNAYVEALGLHPEFATVHRGLGELEMALGDNPAARQQFAEAIRIDPYDHEIQIKYAAALEAAGLSDETRKVWDRAIELRPECWYGYNEIARFHLDHGRNEEAAQAFQQIIRLAPDHATALNNLAYVYVKVGRYEDAIERAADSMRFGNRIIGYSTLGLAYLYRGCSSDALLNLNYALADANLVEKETGRKYSRRFLLWYNLAEGLEAAGRAREAQDALRETEAAAREFLALDPGYRVARGFLALSLASLGIRREALQEIESLRKLAPNNEEVLFQLALAYEKLGDREQALESLKLALANGLYIHEISRSYPLAGLREDSRYRAILAQSGRRPSEDAGNTTLLREGGACPGWERPGQGLRTVAPETHGLGKPST
jgi:tetratricopeptide (TPR) repeat protein